ncbi:hypothetical protein ACQ4PT_004476 [Festuca glaucescens]
MDCRTSTTTDDLERMLYDDTAEPKALPLSLLAEITIGFSAEHQIGEGGFAVIYQMCSRDALGDAGVPPDTTPAAGGHSPPHRSGIPSNPPQPTSHQASLLAAPLLGRGSPEGSQPGSGASVRSRRGIVVRSCPPGEVFQSYVSTRFSSFLSFSPTIPAVSGEIWVTPPFSSPCFTEVTIGSILSFFFCGTGDSLSATTAGDWIFHVVVASPAVASFLLLAGRKHCARFNLGFHGSLALASLAAADLAPTAPPISGVGSKRRRRHVPTWSRHPASSVGFGGEGLLPLPRAQKRVAHPSSIDVPSEVASSFKVNACSAPLHPYAGAPRSAHAALEPNAPGSPAAAASAAFNAPDSPPPARSYLEAASCPPAPSPATPRAPFKNLNLSLDGCFRCLSSLHQVRECRDPIRCRGCGRSSHRLRECTMPFPQPTSVPTVTTPPPPAAAPRRRATPYPSALPSPLPFSSGTRRARSYSPARRHGVLFEVGEASQPAAAAAAERVISMVEPAAAPFASPGPLEEDEEEVESDDDSIPPLPEVFMPPGNMEAARMYVSGLGSSIGDLYAKFLSEEDRELAMLHQPFLLDGATFRLVREEEADRIPCDMQWVALVLARRVPVEHLCHLNVAVSFSCFGETLEVDAASLSGADYAAVRAVVRLKHERYVPAEILLSRAPWGSRLISLRKVRVWRVRDSYNSDGEYVPFFRPPPPPLFQRRLGALPLAPARLPPAPPADDDSRGEPGLGGHDDALDAHAALLAVLDSVASSPALGPPPPPRSTTSSSSITISWCSLLGSEDVVSSLKSGPPLAFTRCLGVVITELEPDVVAPTASTAVAPAPKVKRSTRLALKEPAHYEPVELRAMKLRGLKDALGSCTTALQKQVLTQNLSANVLLLPSPPPSAPPLLQCVLGILKNGKVAVKRLSNKLMDDKEFLREVECLMTVKHKNVVRFLGYFANTQGSMELYNGKLVMADVTQRLLCFEYLSKGSLDQYITDASCGLEWRNRYKIIKGISHGFFHENQSRAITANIGGTLGYLPPEFCNGEITYLFDRFSLGVIFMELLTGKKGYHDVVESWSNRLEESWGDIQLEQVRVCAEIGIECTDSNPAKGPDSTQHIIDRLDETGSMDGYIEAGMINSHQNFSFPWPTNLSMDQTPPAQMSEVVLPALTKIGSILGDESTMVIIANLSKKVTNLKKVPGQVEQIGKQLGKMGIVIGKISIVHLADGITKSWIGEVRKLACRVEDVMDKCSYHVAKLKGGGLLKKFAMKRACYDKVFTEIMDEVAEVDKEIQLVIQMRDQWLKPCKDSFPVFIQDEGFVGIEDNRILLTRWPYSKEPESNVLTVSGMGGLGKSTLVSNVYEREKISFSVHAWIAVSQIYNVDALFRKLLWKIGYTEQPSSVGIDKMDVNALKKEIQKRLENRKYLIVIDDVWEKEIYMQMHDAFENLQGSRIIITTRKDDVAKISSPTRHLELRPLNKPDAFDLFCRRAFYNHKGHMCPKNHEMIATAIVDRCRGMLQAIVTIGSMLSFRQELDIWQQTYYQLLKLSTDDHVRDIINLCYHDLSGDVRNCLVYCSLFPGDHPMSRDSLVRLWVAEGFVLSKGNNAPEVVAERILMELIHRNMLEVVEIDELGRVTTCKMHDIVRELAFSFAEEERYASANDYSAMIQIDRDVRRLSLCGWNDSSALKLKFPRLRTVVSLGLISSSPDMLSSILSVSNYLTVLELQD